jgi:hypothetical protein
MVLSCTAKVQAEGRAIFGANSGIGPAEMSISEMNTLAMRGKNFYRQRTHTAN